MGILLTEFWFLSLWKSHILVEENLFSSYNDFKHFNHEQNTKKLSGDKIALEQLKLIQEGEKICEPKYGRITAFLPSWYQVLLQKCASFWLLQMFSRQMIEWNGME